MMLTQRILTSTVLLLCAASAHATTITIMSATSIANAQAEETAWVQSTFGSNWNPQILETFEGFNASNQTGYNSLSTGVGTFGVMAGSQAGDPSQSNGTKLDQFTLLNAADTPFSGRYNTTAGGNNWLDSNDITQIQLTTSLSTLIFMITDVNDCGGILTLQTADGTTSNAFAHAPTAKDGNIYFVGITSASALGTIKWLNNSTNDGWGIDDLGTVVDPPPPYNPPTSPVPEPSAWPVLGAGLIAIPLVRKYRKARAPQA